VVHGELRASETLAGEINKRFGMKVNIPTWKESFIFEAKGKGEAGEKFESEAAALNRRESLEKRLLIWNKK